MWKAANKSADWGLRILGILFATCTIISLIASGFDVSLSDVPKAILAQYIWVRNTLFQPLDWILREFGMSITNWAKDIITFYVIVGGAMWRTTAGGTLWIRLYISFLWPMGFLEMELHRRRSIKETMSDPDVSSEPLSLAGKIRKIYWYFAVELFVLVTITFCFFAWNYIQVRFGAHI